MKVKKLKNVGIEILDVDITNLSDEDYLEIKKLLIDELIILIRNQFYDHPFYFAKLSSRMGGIGNHAACRWNYLDGDIKNPNEFIGQFEQPHKWKLDKKLYPVQRVTGYLKEGKSTGIFGSGILDWHSNMHHKNNAAGVALQAIDSVDGTSTSFLDTTVVYKDMSNEMKNRCKNVIGKLTYDPDVWAAGLPKDQRESMLSNHINLYGSLDYDMPLLNKTISGNKTGMFFPFYNRWRFPEDPTILEDLKNLCLQDKYIYQHWWEPGDIILMEQRLTLHKRDQNDPEMLKNRLLHRYTIGLNYHNGSLIV